MPRRHNTSLRVAGYLDFPDLSNPQRRNSVGARFDTWCRDTLGASAAILSGSGLLISPALKAYGRQLYATEQPIHFLIEAILWVSDNFGHTRSALHPAWAIVSRWEAREPGEHRQVLPEILVRAVISVAYLWNWTTWLANFLIGFAFMAHPSEFLSNVRRNLVLPCDL